MANILGVVFMQNPSQTFISDATITLVGSTSSFITRTDYLGGYSFTNLQAGDYLLTVYYNPLNFSEERKVQMGVNNVNENFIVAAPLIMSRTSSFVKLKYFQYYFLAVLGLSFVVPLVYGLFTTNFKILRDMDAARGIISYLIVVVTVGMATTLMFAAIMTGGKEMDRRFDLGKQVLTSLIGVLGTILGFYFGLANKTELPTNQEKKDSLSTAVVIVKPPIPSSDSTQTLVKPLSKKSN